MAVVLLEKVQQKNVCVFSFYFTCMFIHLGMLIQY